MPMLTLPSQPYNVTYVSLMFDLFKVLKIAEPNHGHLDNACDYDRSSHKFKECKRLLASIGRRLDSLHAVKGELT